uniref:COMM domain containing 7 n=1 Tax=Taeniopygia guttata TaxID=59729 RepID=H0Z7T1_TAEGU
MLRLRRGRDRGRAGGAAAAAAAAMGLLNFTRDPVPEAVSGDMHNLNQLSAQQFSALTEVLFRYLTEPKEVERFLTQLSDFATMNKISLGPLKNIVKSILLVPNALGCHGRYQNRSQQITLHLCYTAGKPRGAGSLLEFMRFLLLASESRILVKVPVLPGPQNKGGRRSGGKCYTHTFTPIIPNTAGALKRNLSSEQVRADFIALGLSEEKASYFAEQWKVNSPTLTRLAVGQTLMINQLIDMEWKFGVTAGSSELEKVGSIFLQLKLVVKKGSQLENVYVELTLPQFYSFLHEMERVKTSLESFS